MSISSEFSAIVFSKDLPQSSFLLDSPMNLSQHHFKNAPRTLFDEIECEKAHMQEHARVNEEEDLVTHRIDDRIEQFKVDGKFSWKSLVRRMREENASLLNTVKSAREDLRQSRRDKAYLEKKFKKHIQMSEAAIHDLKLKLEMERSGHRSQRGSDGPDILDQQYQIEAQEEMMQLQDELNAAKNKNLKLTADLEEHKEHIRVIEDQLLHGKAVVDKQSKNLAIEEDMEALKAYLREIEQKYENERKKRMELIFQKRYLLLANQALEECELRAMNGQDTKHILSPASKWRACFTAIVAAHRLRKLIKPSS